MVYFGNNMRPFHAVFLLAGSALAAGCGPRPLPPPQIVEPIVIGVTGTNYNWHVRNPGPDGRLNTEDDIYTVQELRVPIESKIRLELQSLDLLYTFSVPEHNLREIAVPDLLFTLEFILSEEGEYELRCEQICGMIQRMVLGSLIAMSKEEYSQWLQTEDAR